MNNVERGIKASVKLSAVVMVDDDNLLAMADVIPSAKKQLFHKIKNDLFDLATNLTEEDIVFEQLNVPKVDKL